MPITLPSKTRVESVRAEKHEPAALDCFGYWLLSVALCAIALAGLAYFADSDNVGASLVLACAAVVIAVMVRVCTGSDDAKEA